MQLPLCFQKCCVVIIENAWDPKFRSISYRFWDKLFLHKNRKIGSFFSKFQTHDLEWLSSNYEKALLLRIGNFAAKFATPCSYRAMLRTKKWRRTPAAGHNNNPNSCQLWVKNYKIAYSIPARVESHSVLPFSVVVSEKTAILNNVQNLNFLDLSGMSSRTTKAQLFELYMFTSGLPK